ncbi:MAG: hypothetical protein ACFFDW_15705 [Candidatus Thorarchaeota archaeon]
MTSNRMNTLIVVRILCIFVMIINLSFIHFSQAKLPNLEEELVIQNPVPIYQLIDVAISNDYLYTTDGYDLYVLNITNKSNPEIISSYRMESSEFVITKDYLYNIRWNSTVERNQFEIYEVKSYTNFKSLANYTEPSHSGSTTEEFVFCEENYSYLLFSYQNDFGYKYHIISILDIANKTNIIQLDLYSSNGFVVDLLVEGNYLYLLKSQYKEFLNPIYSGENCIDIYDIENKSEIIHHSRIDLNFQPKSFQLKNEKLYILKNNGFNILKLDYPLSSPDVGITSNSTFNIDLKTIKLGIEGNKGYLIFNYGLLSLDLSDENNIKEIDRMFLRMSGVGIFTDFIYADSYIYALRHIDAIELPLFIFDCTKSEHIGILYPREAINHYLSIWFDIVFFGYIFCPIIIVIISSLSIYKIIKLRRKGVENGK